MTADRECPECGSDFVDRQAVDIGVGTQHGPWHCLVCGWQEGPVADGLLEMLDDLEHSEDPW